MISRIVCFLCLCCITTLFSIRANAQLVQEPIPYTDEWTKPYAPFRVAGNLYYVGTYDLASYLLTTPAGHILINTGIASSADVIRTNMKKLGFELADVRILLTNQAHYDHVGALAAIKKMTNAKFMVNKKDAGVMADGGRSDYYFGGDTSSFQPVQADRLLNDKDTIVLGGTVITMLDHPGHTMGSSSFLVTVQDNAKSYRVLIANMPSIIVEKKFSETKTYPTIATDYAYTLDAMEKAEFDLWVAAHASQFDLHQKRKAGDKYNPAVFADKELFRKKMAAFRKSYDQKLAEE